MRWAGSRQSGALLLAALATAGCQALIGLDEVGPRPAASGPMASVGGSGGASGMSQGGTAATASGGSAAMTSGGSEPSAGAPCNVEPPLVSSDEAPLIPVAKAPAPPAIDGEADDIWCLARKFQPRRATGDPDASMLAASGRLLWDESRLYLLLEVEDDMLYDEGFFWYDDDYTWLGLDPTAGEAGDDELLFGFTISSRDAQDFESWPLFDRARLLIAHARIGERSTFEVAIPWELMTGFVPATGKELGFELRVADTDDGAGFTTLNWANADEHSYEQPGSWGRLTLVGPR